MSGHGAEIIYGGYLIQYQGREDTRPTTGVSIRAARGPLEVVEAPDLVRSAAQAEVGVWSFSCGRGPVAAGPKPGKAKQRPAPKAKAGGWGGGEGGEARLHSAFGRWPCLGLATGWGFESTGSEVELVCPSCKVQVLSLRPAARSGCRC